MTGAVGFDWPLIHFFCAVIKCVNHILEINYFANDLTKITRIIVY